MEYFHCSRKFYWTALFQAQCSAYLHILCFVNISTLQELSSLWQLIQRPPPNPLAHTSAPMIKAQLVMSFRITRNKKVAVNSSQL